MTRIETRKAEKWVLVPGTLCTDRVFAPLLDQLGVQKCDRHFVSVDAPDVRDYKARFETSLKGGDIVCGFSLGALVLAHNLDALKAARAVVLLASNPFPDPPGNRANREAVRDRVLAGDARGWIAENWAAMSATEGEELRQFVASMAEDTSHLITAQTELAASRPGAEDQLLNTDLPLIFVTGSEDRLTPSASIREIVDNATSAHLSVVEDLGHFALIEAPDRVADAIREGFEAVGLKAAIEGHAHVTREHSSVTS
ncbi:MAG: alpha/beta hydrolase [Paracoccaceae bacterium]|nr:alpha/beta hydrolase [Paracoccaceae bacterium]